MSVAPEPPKPPDPSGNTANLLRDLTSPTATAINTVSDLIGTIADVAGAIGAVGAVVSIIQSFMGSGAPSVQQLLSEISAQIQADFAQLGHDLGAAQLLARNQAIAGFLFSQDGAYSYLQGLNDSVNELNAQPPQLTPNEVHQQIQTVLGAVDGLAGGLPDLVWNVTYDWQVYWTDSGTYYTPDWEPVGIPGRYSPFWVDVGYGLQAPSKPADGNVFTYVVSLPAYQYAVAIFIAVGLALDPQFVSNPSWRPALQQIATFLQSQHQTVQEGITFLSPFSWTTASITGLSYLGALPGEEVFGPVAGIRQLWTGLPPDYAIAHNLGAIIEYGAVEKYSGFSAVEPNYIVSLSGISFPSPLGPIPGNDDPGPFNKLQLRVLKKAKDVYIGTGLLGTWNVINQVRQLVGEEPLPRPNYADWSFRRDILPTTQVAASNGTWRLKSVAQFIETTVPLDTPNTANRSFRALLNPIPTVAPSPPPPPYTTSLPLSSPAVAGTVNTVTPA